MVGVNKKVTFVTVVTDVVVTVVVYRNYDIEYTCNMTVLWA